MVLQCFCMMEEIQGSWGLNEIENITRSGFSFFSTFFKATSLGIALARTIAESIIFQIMIQCIFACKLYILCFR